MQDAELAIKELERCHKIGLVGIQIGSNINDENLNEERFFPIFQACENLGMAVLVHPWAKEVRQVWSKVRIKYLNKEAAEQ